MRPCAGTTAEYNEVKTKDEVTHADLRKALSSLNSTIAPMDAAKPSAASLSARENEVGKNLQRPTRGT